jgi:hypothetical protein
MKRFGVSVDAKWQCIEYLLDAVVVMTCKMENLAKHFGTSRALGEVMLTTHMTRPLRNGLGLILLDLCEAGPRKPWSVYAYRRSQQPTWCASSHR